VWQRRYSVHKLSSRGVDLESTRLYEALMNSYAIPLFAPAQQICFLFELADTVVKL
jgi:hypothetical protein